MARTELRSEVEIDAPATDVYRVLTDFARYHEWNPFLTAIRGELVVGKRLSVEMSLPEGGFYELAPTLLAVSEASELRWQGPFLFPVWLEAEHFFLLSERAPGVTRLVQGENFSGLLLRFATSSLTLAARGAVYMNQALKKRVEAGR
jgi:hypothetical protein